MFENFRIIEAFSEYIKNIGLYLVFTSFVILIIPKSNYKDYINLVMGLILIILFISPLFNLFSNKENINLNDFTNSSPHFEMLETDFNLDLQESLIIESYSSSLKSQIENIVSSNNALSVDDIELTINNSEEFFGEIKNIKLQLTYRAGLDDLKSEDTEYGFIRIDSIKIGSNPQNENIDTDSELTELVNNLKISISNFYNLSIDNIHINIHKKSEE